ncbi:putative DNA binding domain-containing protein [Hymenobacter sp. BT507]|uniref:DNA binding domain-containing protein n=1 Tax=Hymenobacter citatus TaxID=2763506 RepID=A0ABR7MIT1_9BACT|nr:RNA-binding domain-containing protein [Hymenobacter citatus]MBC6610972.1 putative DNA binding domain-containing protein [Hymenobacter citatus]
MKTLTISGNDALELSTKEESHFYDRKAAEIKPASLQKHAVAFANADGGDVIIGIADDKDEPDPVKRWKGLKDVEDFNSIFQVLAEVNPSITYSATFLVCPEKPGVILRLTIEKSDKVHSTSDKTVYVRRSAQSLPLKDPIKIQELSFAKGESSFEDYIINDAVPEDIFDSKEIRNFLKDYSPHTDPIDFTVGQNLVNRKDFSPRSAGILLFADNPSVVIPRKCAVKITRYETSDLDPTRDHLREQYSLEGPLYSLIQETVDKITQVMADVVTWTARGLHAVAYPPETIWEIVVNALIHRDYSISDDVHVLVFDNRIEVLSPGKLPGYVTVDNILEARFSRNSKIVRTLNRYKNPPNKDMGEGLDTAFKRMSEMQLSEPIIRVENNYVRVIISHTKIASAEVSILDFLQHNTQITNSIVRNMTGIRSENTVKDVFYKLSKRNIIERVPGLNGNLAAWRLTTAGKKLIADGIAAE